MPRYNIHYTSKSDPGATEVDVVWGVNRNTAESAIEAVAGDLAKDPHVHSFHIKEVTEEN